MQKLITVLVSITGMLTKQIHFSYGNIEVDGNSFTQFKIDGITQEQDVSSSFIQKGVDLEYNMTVQTYDRNGGRVFSLLILNYQEYKCYNDAHAAFIKNNTQFECEIPKFKESLQSTSNKHFFQNIDSGYETLTSAQIKDIWNAKKVKKSKIENYFWDNYDEFSKNDDPDYKMDEQEKYLQDWANTIYANDQEKNAEKDSSLFLVIDNWGFPQNLTQKPYNSGPKFTHVLKDKHPVLYDILGDPSDENAETIDYSHDNIDYSQKLNMKFIKTNSIQNDSSALVIFCCLILAVILLLVILLALLQKNIKLKMFFKRQKL